jgi:NADH-quinone oxidoreductase subunit L
MSSYIYLVILFPLIGFVINGLFGAKIKNEKVIGIIGSGALGLSFLVALFILFEMISLPSESRKKTVELFTWISTGTINIKAAYLVDQLSIIMTLVVTGVGFLIHVYSIGYMHGDKGFWRFFAYLNLFIFAMLNLVLADNFLLLFLGWEGVGLCSYLLIGFWYEKDFDKGTTGDAAKKAFIVNRIGDFGFLIGMFLIFITFQSLNFDTVFSMAEGFDPGNKTIMLITLFLFIGCTGKSAQIPLYVWLPDAMAGPTPVSALIHAATMVTAGVYLVARCSILFALAPVTLNVISVIAITTAFFAATIGLVQNDIKKVLAYSTVSQLGYMFLGMGVGAFTAGIFHLMTHAFFKACLFLGSGSVIHAMHEEQDIQKMGGLESKMKTTYLTFFISALAIGGIPPLSGFFSKDEILWKAFSHGSVLLWLIGFITAGLTAFYMFRLVGLTFGGKPRWDEEKHPHESPKVMTIPLILLAFLAIIGGFIGIPASLGGGNSFEKWLEPVFAKANEKMAAVHEFSHSAEYVLMALSIIIALAGILLAWNIYTKNLFLAEKFRRSYKNLYNILLNKYYVDEIYDAGIINPIVKTSRGFLWKFFDTGVIDGLINNSARLMGVFGQMFRRLQTGVVQSYAVIFITGIIFILFWLIIK